MVVDPTPRCVGLEFVRQYYTVLNKAPQCLHRFYSNDSKFLHSGEVVMGQTEIHKKILSLGFHDCHAKIQLVDAFSTLGDGVLIQVTGELSNNGLPMRKFTQSIVLAPQSPKKYYVHSDIFHYIDEVFTEETNIDDTGNDGDDELEIATNSAQEDNFVGTVNGNIHEQSEVPAHSVASMQNLPQTIAPENNYTVPPSMAKNPPSVSPIPHINPHHACENMINARSPNSVKEDISNDAICQDEWIRESPPLEVSPAKSEEEKPKPVVMDPPKPVPQPVVSNEPKTYANLLKNISSFPSATMQAVTSNQYGEPAPVAVTNHINKPKMESRTFSKLSGNDSSGSFPKPSNKHFQEDDRRRFLMPDSHQVFVGNLPHTITEDELKDAFQEFGSVADVRINTAKGKTSAKGDHPVPNFGFISFESEESVSNCLSARPIFLSGDSSSRINVEEKKARTSRVMDGNGMQRPSGRGGIRGGMSQGRGAGMRGGFNRENRGRGSFNQRR